MTAPPTPAESRWFAELDFDPASSWLAMGTRALGRRSWLIADDDLDRQLRLKAELCRDRHADVFAAVPGTESASATVVDLVADAGAEVPGDTGLHPLDRAGRSVQEDLCLLERRVDGWYLVAGSVCFPSRWRLADKLDRHVTAVHAPVPGYAEVLARKVDQLFDRLTERPVWRRNWFVHPDAALFQPERPERDPLIGPDDVGSGLVIRSERQTLRSVVPGWILFTIKTQQAPLSALLADPVHGNRFVTYLDRAPSEHVSHRGISPEQRSAIEASLAG